jgi:serine/threonine protein kinase/tetratricopeptide (TPR) repeat protein
MAGGKNDPASPPTVTPGELLDPTVANEDAGRARPTGAGEAGRRGAAGDAARLPVVGREHYAVEGEFARGGMGRILSARDRRLSRPVALKELQAAASADAGRFVREALVTARLQHPAIVPVYEAGRWPDGVPFYAMKLVSGRTLDALLREAGSLAGRLALLPHLLAVAEAVAYAHSQRVVHRDLKPQNVLVGPFGETVVVDWGLAKDLAAEGEGMAPAPGEPSPAPAGAAPAVPSPARGSAGGSDATVAGSVLGTPAFMPPEQARGEAVDERADVYALGAMLYYLLAGAPPRSGTTVLEVLRAAATERPRPLAEREPAAPPELVAVVDKAMDPEPARRYRDAGELAADLRRFQTGQLVSAHRYSPGELLRRWVRQHRAVVTVAAVLSLALAVAVVTGFLAVRRQARIAEAERDRARAAARTAEEANAFLREMLGAADPRTEGSEVTVVSVLDRAQARLDAIASQPELQSALQLTLGQTYQGLGLLEPAERLVRASLATRERVHGRQSPDAARSRLVLAQVVLDRGDLAAAERLFRESVEDLDRAGQSDSVEGLSARADLAVTLQNLGRLDEAEALHRDVLDRQRRTLGDGRPEVAATLSNLGVVLGQKGRWAEAEPLHREALDIVRRVSGPRSPDTASALATLGSALEARGDLAGAEALYRESLALRRDVLGPEHPDTVRSLYALAYLLRSRGAAAEAEALSREALALRGRVLPDEHPMVAAVLQVLGLSLLDRSRGAEAEPVLRESLALRRAALPEGHWLVASSEGVLGDCLSRRGRYREAEPLLLRAHEALAAHFGPAHERAVEARKRLVALYEAWGRPADAARFRQAPRPSGSTS